MRRQGGTGSIGGSGTAATGKDATRSTSGFAGAADVATGWTADDVWATNSTSRIGPAGAGRDRAGRGGRSAWSRSRHRQMRRTSTPVACAKSVGERPLASTAASTASASARLQRWGRSAKDGRGTGIGFSRGESPQYERPTRRPCSCPEAYCAPRGRRPIAHRGARTPTKSERTRRSARTSASSFAATPRGRRPPATAPPPPHAPPRKGPGGRPRPRGRSVRALWPGRPSEASPEGPDRRASAPGGCAHPPTQKRREARDSPRLSTSDRRDQTCARCSDARTFVRVTPSLAGCKPWNCSVPGTRCAPAEL